MTPARSVHSGGRRPPSFLFHCRILLAVVLGTLAGSAAAADARIESGMTGSAARPTGTFSREQLLADLGRRLAAQFDLVGELQLELLRPWSAPARSAASWTLDVLEYPPAVASSMLVRGRLLADGEPAGEVTLVIRAALWREAWVARQSLVVGAVLEPAALATRRVDMLRDRDAVPAEPDDSEWVLARNVAAGRLLTARDLARRPLVRKGQVVEVAAGEGMLLITLKAVAMENGARGDTIILRNPESRKNFSALVTHENRVQVRF